MPWHQQMRLQLPVCMYVELVIMEIRVDSKRFAQDELSAASHSRDTED